MGCCSSTPERIPLIAPDPVDSVDPDPTLTRFKELYHSGSPIDIIPTRVVAGTMGVSAITMGRMLTKWGYELDRKYINGRRERVVMGVCKSDQVI